MAKTHVAAQGESLDSIARAHGLRGAAALREHPGNSSCLRCRPHDEILFPGDTLEIPEAEPGFVIELDERTQFRRAAPRTTPLSLVLVHVDGTPMRSCDVTIEHAAGPTTARTTDDGALDVALPLGTAVCTIVAGAYAWDVELAHLNPVHETDDDGISGAQGRLRNLGYFHGEVDGVDSPELQDALALFQVACDLPRTGTLDDATTTALHDAHGC